MPTVIVYQLGTKARTSRIAEALEEGCKAIGLPVVRAHDKTYIRPLTNVTAFYGYENKTPRIMADYVASGRKVVYVDLGYWGRRDGGRFEGYHKIAINGRHPTEYFRRVKHPADRLTRFGVRPLPWRKGTSILLAGMGDKAAKAEGYQPNEWEQWAISEIRKHTDRPIMYRPKPSWKEATQIEGAAYDNPMRPIEWSRYHCVVTHHSNVGVEALAAGVPVFSAKGVASVMGTSDLSRIETPVYPDDRQQFLQDVAYCQWNVAEMRSGAMWRHLQGEGLV